MAMGRLTIALVVVGLLYGIPREASAQLGVLLVEGAGRPDPDVLALDEVEVAILIDHLHVTVRLTQVFENRTERSLASRYELALGPGNTLSSLTLWDRDQRREAVVVTPRQGQQTFDSSSRGVLDPGLLEASGGDRGQGTYAVRVDPIVPYGRVRIEVGYSQELELTDDEAMYVLPMASREHTVQRANRLTVQLDVDGAWPLRSVELEPTESFQFDEPFSAGQTSFQAVLDQREATLSADLVVALRLDRRPRSQPFLPALLTFRKSNGSLDRSAFGGGPSLIDDRGYFMLQTPVQLEHDADDSEGPQDVVIALDTSLSMRGGKLERAVAAIEGLLGMLAPSDNFGVVTFNDSIRSFPRTGLLVPATAEKRAEARSFFRSGYLSGGTDLLRALPAAFKRLDGSSARRRTVVMITDGQPSLGQLETAAITSAATGANDALGRSRAQLFIMGVGDDVNDTLLGRLARDAEGSYSPVGVGADIEPYLRRFLHRLDANALDDVRLGIDAADGVEALYPVAPARVRDGSTYNVVGRYKGSTKAAQFRLQGALGTKHLEHILTAPLPRQDTTRSWIARSWAQHRVVDLLERIDVDGERPEWIGEIVALASEHLLVTPYTSLITAARSLLRPREITPGDPVLTVRADPSDRAVTALFPFGTIKALRHIEPGLFETRFLAPRHLADGRHEVDLVITGRDGRQRLVRDHFVIDSRAPRPYILPIQDAVRAGDRLTLRVRSDQDTRHLAASIRIPGQVVSQATPVAELRWNAEELACVGDLLVDPTLPTGTYDLVVVAEDHAHNVGSTSTPLDVRGQ